MSQKIAVSASQHGMGRLTVPAAIVRALGDDLRLAHFEAELTDEGILYRYAGSFENQAVPRPTFLKGQA